MYLTLQTSFKKQEHISLLLVCPLLHLQQKSNKKGDFLPLMLGKLSSVPSTKNFHPLKQFDEIKVKIKYSSCLRLSSRSTNSYFFYSVRNIYLSAFCKKCDGLSFIYYMLHINIFYNHHCLPKGKRRQK